MDKETEIIAEIGKAKILCLEVCPQRFGFAVFDGPVDLIDWGTMNYRATGARRLMIVRERLSSLLKLHSPTCLVMRWRSCSSIRANTKTRSAVETIREEAKQNALKAQNMSTKEVLRFFSTHDCRTKQEIASRIAFWFTELSPKLPRARKPWQPERHNMVVFDAAASGITFFARDPSIRLGPKETN
jgi:hypothetical protein